MKSHHSRGKPVTVGCYDVIVCYYIPMQQNNPIITLLDMRFVACTQHSYGTFILKLRKLYGQYYKKKRVHFYPYQQPHLVDAYKGIQIKSGPELPTQSSSLSWIVKPAAKTSRRTGMDGEKKYSPPLATTHFWKPRSRVEAVLPGSAPLIDLAPMLSASTIWPISGSCPGVCVFPGGKVVGFAQPISNS